MHDAPKGRMMQIIPAKLTRPSSKGVLPRERLFRSIESGREKKVLWISGPAGSGKTTLAASYFDSHTAPCIWYQLDEGDKDLATFFYYLGLAAKKAAPRNRKPLPLLTPEYLQGIPVFAKRFFEQLGESLIGRSRGGSFKENGRPAIVFDSYQDVPDDSMFHEVVNAGLSSISEGLNVTILSRSEPPPAYARLRAGSEMSFLGWEDIRLTAGESNAIAMLKARRDLSDETLSQLYQAARATPSAVLSQRDLQAFYYWLSADFEKNRWAADDGIALADSTGVHFMDWGLLGHIHFLTDRKF